MTYPSMPAEVLAWIEADNPGHVTGRDFVGLGAYRVTGPLDVAALQRALDDVVRHTEILRTELTPDFRHRPRPAAPVPLTVLDTDEPAGREIPAPLLDRIGEGDAPLRVLVARHGDDRWTLVLVGRHEILDHWSMELVVQDLCTAYDARRHGREPVLASPQFRDSAAAAYTRRYDDRLAAAVAYWRMLLTDAPPVFAPVAAPGGFTAERLATIPVDRAALAAAGRAARTTPFVCLLTGYALALSAVTGVHDLIVPLFTSGRARTDWEAAGPFMNIAAVRVDLGGDPAPAEALARTHAAFITALSHELPLAVLLPEVPDIARLYTAGDLPVCGFELVQFPPPEPATLTLDRLPIGPRHGATVLPLSALLCWLEPDGEAEFACTVRYRPGLVGADTIDALIRALHENLHAITSLGRTSVGSI